MASVQNLGPILTERAPTVGRHKVLVGLSYQYFDFDRADGISLRNFPTYFFGGPTCGFCNSLVQFDSISAQNRLNLKIHEVTPVAVFGLTSRLDISVAIPFLSVGLSMTSTATVNTLERAPYESDPTADPYSCNNNPVPGVIGCMNQFSVKTIPGETLLPITNPLLGHNRAIFTSTGSASGIGDLILRTKFQAIKRERAGVAIGIDLHAPTGAETQFLGSGAWGVRPFAAFSYAGRIEPHASLGFQINGHSILATDPVSGSEGVLPSVLSYDAGVDAGVRNWLSISADFLGLSLRRAFKTEEVTFQDFAGNSYNGLTQAFSDAGDEHFNRNQLSFAVGTKFRPIRKLIVSADVLFRLDEPGLHSRPVPLIGVSYEF